MGFCWKLNHQFLIWALALWILCLLSPMAQALNESPQTFTLDGHLFQTGTTAPLLDSTAKITVQIINPNGTCLLYEEQQTVNTAMTDGYFNIQVGSLTGNAKRTVNDPGRTMTQIFQNLVSITANSVTGQTCAGGAYAPSAGDIRYFRLVVTPSGTNVADTLTPDIVISSMPQALVAQSVQGVERAHILQVNNSGSTTLTQANLEALFTTPAYANLQSILAGHFMPIDSSGASLPAYAANPAGAANGDIWFDTLTNEVKYKNAAGVQTVGVSSGGITSLTVGSSMSVNGSVAGTISSSGTIDLSNTGVTAGTYTKMTVDAKGRVTAGTVSLVEADIPNLTSAGKVSGNTVISGTISGSAEVNTSGNLITTATVSGLTVQATNLRVYNGANYLQMTASTMSGNVNLTMPATTGSAGQFLSTDGNGILSWSGITSLLAGDVSGAFGSTSVDKIKGKSITAGSVSGQMMIYNGTAWTNNVMSGDATLAHDGMFTLSKVPVTKGGTNVTSFGSNRIIASNGTGTALQDFTCSLNQVISFDTTGNAVCANVSSLSAMILNGGNTTSADISIGTNDNYALRLKAKNTVAVMISNDGNVNIGGDTSYALTALQVANADTWSTATPAQLLMWQYKSVGGAPQIIGNWNASGVWGIGTVNTTEKRLRIGLVDGDVTKVPMIWNGTQDLILETPLLNVTNGGNSYFTGKLGVGVTAPSSSIDISGAMTAQGMSSAPSVSVANTGRIYYDFTANKFKVSQNGAAYVDLVGGGAGSGYANGGNAFGGAATLGTTDNYSLSIKTNNVTAMTISQSGKVGIGMTLPTEALEVNGNIKATELILSSDRNLKRDIRPLENSLENLLRLSGVSYKWRCEEFPDRKFDGLEHMGLIAQEVAKIYPDLVHGKEGNLAVDYTGLIAPIIEAIKEQNSRLRTLQSTVSRLEEEKSKQQDQLQLLMKRIEALEKR